MNIGKIPLLLPLLLLTATQAHAVNWVSAPLACLPDRAIPWTNNSKPELCHCPPQSMCPNTASVTPADVNFQVSLQLCQWGTHTGTGGSDPCWNFNFTISGTDVATYYSSQPSNPPYAPFDPSQIFVMKDNPLYACPNGVQTTMSRDPKTFSTTQGWGATQDYITPLVRKWFASQGIDYESYTYKGPLDAFCSLTESGPAYYNVAVTVTPQVANTINNQAMLMPDTLLSRCCPSTFACPTGSTAQTGSGNSSGTQTGSQTSVSCVVTVDQSRVGCLLQGTPVLLASGKSKQVEQIALGDRLKGDHGEVTVIALNQFTQNADEMYGFNGSKAFITSEHPVLTTNGWKAINPALTTIKSGIGHIGQLKVGDQLITATGTLKITSIEKHVIQSPATAYNLAVKGGNGFLANGIVVKAFSQVEIHY